MICDLAETYHIYQLKALPPSMVARLVFGLRDDSRTKMSLSGIKIKLSDLLLAQCVDRLSLVWWAQTEDGRKNVNRPKSIASILVGNEESNNILGFESGEAWELARDRILKKGG